MPATVNAALAQCVSGDAVLGPFEGVTPTQLDVLVGRGRSTLSRIGGDEEKINLKHNFVFVVM